MRPTPISFILTLLLTASTCPAESIIYVNAAATGANDGSSWPDAHIDLQDALDQAHSLDGEPCEIWVAAGTYKPDRGTGSPEETFSLVSGVALYGGFAGYETSRDQRDPAYHTTFLSGDLLDNDESAYSPNSTCCTQHAGPGCDDAACQAAVCIINPYCCGGSQWTPTCSVFAAWLCCDVCSPDRCDNSYHVLNADGVGPGTVLDSFTVRGGHARINQPHEYVGAGLRVQGGDLNVESCIFTDNLGHGGGSAIAGYSTASLEIGHSQFVANRGSAVASYGPDAIMTVDSCEFVENWSSLGSVYGEGEFLVKNSVFDANVADPRGPASTTGAIVSRGSATIIGCQFTNHADTDAVVTCWDSCLIIDSEFRNNRPSVLETGLNSNTVLIGSRFVGNIEVDQDYLSGGAIFNNGNCLVSDCAFEGNSVSTWGGAIENHSHLIAKRSSFVNNSASHEGGAIDSLWLLELSDCLFDSNESVQFRGGALWIANFADIEHCLFRRNIGHGYAIDAFLETYLSVRDSVFSQNQQGTIHVDDDTSATISRCTFFNNLGFAQGGGGIVLNSSLLTRIDSCVFWGNTSGGSVEDSQIINLNPTNIELQIDYSVVEGWTGQFGGVGNSDADPLFADPYGPDEIPGTDDDNLRLTPDSPCINAGERAYFPEASDADADGHARLLCGRVDMGAYEYGIGDYDCDDMIELSDFAGFPACLTGPAPAQPYPSACAAYDFAAEINADIDLLDFAGLQNAFASGE